MTGEILTIALLLAAGAFIKIFVVLSILFLGLGLWRSGMSIVITVLSLCLSFFVLESSGIRLTGWDKAGVGGVEELYPMVRPMVLRGATPELREKFEVLAQDLQKNPHSSGESISQSASPPTKAPQGTNRGGAEKEKMGVELAAFIVSEGAGALQLGAKILIPFLVLDLVVMNILQLLNVRQLSMEVVSIPLKLLFFVAIDGWGLIVQRIFQSYLS